MNIAIIVALVLTGAAIVGGKSSNGNTDTRPWIENNQQ